MHRARVDVVEGPDAGRGADLPLGARLVVGRGEEAGLRLTDALASRRHCALEHGLGGVTVEDLGSRGGLTVDGVRAARVVVVAGAEVALGRTRLRVVRAAAAGPAPPRVPGVRLGARLGGGASGEVFEGALEPGGEAVAVKVLAADADATTRARFEQEVRLAAGLVHPGIARVLDLRAADDGRPALVRALARGETLEAALARGRLAWPAVARLGAALADALAHAHARGVVHRDVKPANVVLGPAGPVLIDFDLAKRADARATRAALTGTGDGLGTLSYAAPEQLAAARDVDARADVYGLGLTLYHAAAGIRPFAEVEPEDFLAAVTTRGPRPLARAAPDLPPTLVAVIARAHALRPADRWPSAAALGAALAALAG